MVLKQLLSILASDLRRWAEAVKDAHHARQRAPQARLLERGASIDADSTVGQGLLLLKGSRILKSSVGNAVSIGADCALTATTVGENVTIGARTYLTDTTVGAGCTIGNDVTTGAGDHPLDQISTSPVFYFEYPIVGVSFCDKQEFKNNPHTYLEEGVIIGNGVFIRNGVRIGMGAVVCSNSTVVKDVPAGAVVGGVPAKPVPVDVKQVVAPTSI